MVRNGVLTIRLSAARNLTLPAHLPPAIEEALSSAQGQNAVSVTPSSVLEERSQKYYGNGNPTGNAPDRYCTHNSAISGLETNDPTNVALLIAKVSKGNNAGGCRMSC